MTNHGTPETLVLYNAECPICSYEIEHYAKYSQSQANPITFHDLNDAEKLHGWNLDPDTAARRLHTLKDGKLYAGIPAFIVLWQDMPKYQWLARLVSVPGVHQIVCSGYDFILAPLIYRWHRVRQKRKAAAS